MEDKDIIYALECCNTHRCVDCPYGSDCLDHLTGNALDLINRQQAEIDRLKAEKDNLIKTYSECQIDNIKEFINELMLLMPEHMMRTNPQPEEWRIKRWINFALDKLYPELVKNGSFFE